MTDKEFFYFCEDNRDFKFERTSERQVLLISPSRLSRENRNREIITQLSEWNEKHRSGRAVDSDTGFYLPSGAMRNPDAAWISHERLNKLSKEELEKFPHL